MDYAIVEIGGKQYRVQKGDVIKTDFVMDRDKKTIKIENVLMRHSGKKVEIGNPYLKGDGITCEVIGEGKERKVIAYKYKKRKSSKVKKGHRQRFVALKIKDIKAE